jgi:hypothetical protein
MDYQPRPRLEPIDYDKLREEIYKRFSKSFEKLAKN